MNLIREHLVHVGAYFCEHAKFAGWIPSVDFEERDSGRSFERYADRVRLRVERCGDQRLMREAILEIPRSAMPETLVRPQEVAFALFLCLSESDQWARTAPGAQTPTIAYPYKEIGQVRRQQGAEASTGTAVRSLHALIVEAITNNGKFMHPFTPEELAAQIVLKFFGEGVKKLSTDAESADGADEQGEGENADEQESGEPEEG